MCQNMNPCLRNAAIICGVLGAIFIILGIVFSAIRDTAFPSPCPATYLGNPCVARVCTDIDFVDRPCDCVTYCYTPAPNPGGVALQAICFVVGIILLIVMCSLFGCASRRNVGATHATVVVQAPIQPVVQPVVQQTVTTTTMEQPIYVQQQQPVVYAQPQPVYMQPDPYMQQQQQPVYVQQSQY